MNRKAKAYDRGDADAYYGRPFSPHIWVSSKDKTVVVEKRDMTEVEKEEYRKGYEDNPSGKKDWE